MSGLAIYYLLQMFSALGAGFAVWKGGAAERFAAGVVAANVAVGLLSEWLAPGSESIIRLANDGLAAVALLAITVRFGALWLGGVMLFYAAQFALHSWYMVTERPPDNTYALLNNINWNGVIWALIIATAFAWRRRAMAARPAEQPAP